MRGTPGVPPLDGETITRLGAALATELGGMPRIVCGRDTRESGEWIEQQLAVGVSSGEGTLVSVGVMPTPGLSLVTAYHGFDAGLVISASHNLFPDNGIKVLRPTGEKASPELERRLEAMVVAAGRPAARVVSTVVETSDLMATYVGHLARIVGDTDLSKLSVAIDCAHGATSEVASLVLSQLGVETFVLHAAPNGKNINNKSGSTCPEALQREVVTRGCCLGFAFDGDGDRVILVDQFGRLVDGDGILFLAALHLKAKGQLLGDSVVATVMSNFGLEAALSDCGIALHRCQVGDAHVREEMVRRGVCLGGEQSGHIIFSDLLPTGDGLGTALSVLRIVAESGQSLDTLVSALTTLPQVLVNVSVEEKRDLAELPALRRVIQTVEEQLSQQGRVLVRYSGTEPLLRIMIEGREKEMIGRLAKEIATCAKKELA